MTAAGDDRATEAGAAGVRTLFDRLAEGSGTKADTDAMVDLGRRLAEGLTTGTTDESAVGHPDGAVLPYGGS